MDRCLYCSNSPSEVGKLNLGNGELAKILECAGCGLRFTNHHESAHESLHSEPSTYDNHETRALKIKQYLDDQDYLAAKSELELRPANKFVLQEIGKLKKGARILEIGCSRGEFVGYLRSQGYNAIGQDISITAIQGAKEHFGDYFVTELSDLIVKFDIIFSVGTIGCVSDPKGLIEELTAYLDNTGVIVLNAPNISPLRSFSRLWPSTLPPDLTRVFSREFFENLGGFNAIEVLEDSMSKRHAAFYKFETIFENEIGPKFNSTSTKHRGIFMRFARKIFIACTLLFLPRIKSEYGLFVKLGQK